MSTNTSSFSRVTYIILLLSCPGLVPAAPFAGGTGSPDDPYQIATAQQLISIGSDSYLLEQHFVLLNDLDLDPNLPGGRTFDDAVITSGRGEFTGSFDGRGHTIKNLTFRVRRSGVRYGSTELVGLFGSIYYGGVVSNLRLEAADAQTVDSEVGILAGENAGRVINCQVTGRVSGNPASSGTVGGLVGSNSGDIVNCRADMDLVSGSSIAGGLAGSNWFQGRIAGCRAACRQVGATYATAGGLVGANSGYIIGCSAVGGILAGDSSFSSGGLAGVNAGTLLNCQADSNVVAGIKCSQIGGLVGDNQGTIINCYANGRISTQDRCCSVGGLVGWNADVPAQWGPEGPSEFRGRVVNSYATAQFILGTNNREVGGLVGLNSGDVTASFWDIETSAITAGEGCGQGLTTAQMQQAGTFLAAGWDFVDERDNGITDAWRMPEGGGYPVLTLSFDGNSPRGLAGEGTAAAPYRIGTPDDLGLLWRHDPGACYQLVANIDLAGIRWLGAPIPTFTGTFNGGGFVISHLTLHESRTAGLFGCLGSNALVTDLGIADANIVGPDDAQNLAVLAGSSYEGRFGSHVTRCYATGRLSAGRRSFALGGLIGRNYSIVTDCYAKVDLSCGLKSGRLGGLLGENHGDAAHAYSAGAIVTPDPNMTCGGLTGTTGGTLTVNNCYFLALSHSGGGPDNGLGVPLTDTRMKQQASFANWDFKNTWSICEGKDYPRLRWEKIACAQP